MSGWLLGMVGAIYLGVASDYWCRGETGMALAFLCYAGANVGLILAGLRL